MKFLILLSCILALSAAQIEFSSQDTCSKNILDFCDQTKVSGVDVSRCHSKFGRFKHDDISDITDYANQHIKRSFEYLLLASHFGGHKIQRPGFEGVFRKLSDSTWEDAIKLVKYVTKRGGNARINVPAVDQTYDLSEMSSLAKAIDIQKTLAKEAHNIHSRVSKKTQAADKDFYDPDVASFLENEFLHQQSESIRKLAGHANDLTHMLMHDKVKSVAVFLFDEYLQSQ